MHRIINDTPDGLFTDHRNMDKLDNRRDNLRNATKQENSRNTSPRAGTSIFKGVSWHKGNKKWCSNLYISGRQLSLGYYADQLSAAKAYNQAALEYFGNFANLNTLTDSVKP